MVHVVLKFRLHLSHWNKFTWTIRAHACHFRFKTGRPDPVCWWWSVERNLAAGPRSETINKQMAHKGIVGITIFWYICNMVLVPMRSTVGYRNGFYKMFATLFCVSSLPPGTAHHLGKGLSSARHGFQRQQNVLQSGQNLCTVQGAFDPRSIATQNNKEQWANALRKTGCTKKTVGWWMQCVFFFGGQRLVFTTTARKTSLSKAPRKVCFNTRCCIMSSTYVQTYRKMHMAPPPRLAWVQLNRASKIEPEEG